MVEHLHVIDDPLLLLDDPKLLIHLNLILVVFLLEQEIFIYHVHLLLFEHAHDVLSFDFEKLELGLPAGLAQRANGYLVGLLHRCHLSLYFFVVLLTLTLFKSLLLLSDNVIVRSGNDGSATFLCKPL